MRLAVVTVNYCCAAELVRGSKAIAAQISQCGGEWWIVDNKSPDDSVAVLTKALEYLPNTHLIVSERNGGFGYGNNQVIRRVISGEIEAEYIYFLNPDAIPEPSAISSMLSYLEEHPEVAVVGSGLINEDGSYTCSLFRFPSFWSEIESALALRPVSWVLRNSRQSLGELTGPGPVDWVAGTSFMVRTDVLRTVGGFDEDFFLYWEEVELCHRIREAGFVIHGLPNAKVRHLGGVSTGMHRPDRRIPLYWHQSRNLYFRKTHGGGPLPLLNAATGVCLLLRRAIDLVKGSKTHTPGFLRDHLKYSIESYRRRLSRQ